MRIVMWVGTVIGMLVILVACNPKTEYDRLVEAELAKGQRYDSLFLELSLGMSVKDFYGKCWELNKVGLIRQGPRNESVQYKITSMKHPATLNFYPNFQDEKIISMPCVITYDQWAPWNKELFGDSLAVEIKQMFMDWYGGNEFMTIYSATRGEAYVKIDGNRQITILPKDELVKALIKDLSIPENRGEKDSETDSEADE